MTFDDDMTFDAGMEEDFVRKNLKLQRFVQELRGMIALNLHSEALLAVANAYGTEEIKTQAALLYDHHMRQGYMTETDMAKRQAIKQALYAHILREKPFYVYTALKAVV